LWMPLKEIWGPLQFLNYLPSQLIKLIYHIIGEEWMSKRSTRTMWLSSPTK
jgi:hypothetical protein